MGRYDGRHSALALYFATAISKNHFLALSVARLVTE
jgi:hypothetical protein